MEGNGNTTNLNGMIYSRKDNPFGISWEEWTARWWQWLLSIPTIVNPGIDMTGNKFDVTQFKSGVIFLPGTYAGSAERHHVISSEKAILFPVINFTTSYSEEPQLKTEVDLRNRAEQEINDMVQKEVIIDGVRLSNIEKYRVQSYVFDLTYPEDNVWRLKSGHTKAISDGYWIFLKHLPHGDHNIHAIGSCSSGKTKIDVTWHLTVKENDIGTSKQYSS